jgi:hypothetical protein
MFLFIAFPQSFEKMSQWGIFLKTVLLGKNFKQGLGFFFVDIVFKGTLDGILFDIFIG